MSSAAAFEPTEGAKVLANFGGGGFWEPGVIAKIHVDGSVDIVYDDGDEEDGVAQANVKAWAEEVSSDEEEEETAAEGTRHAKAEHASVGLAAASAGMAAANGEYRALPQAAEGGKAEFVKTDKVGRFFMITQANREWLLCEASGTEDLAILYRVPYAASTAEGAFEALPPLTGWVVSAELKCGPAPTFQEVEVSAEIEKAGEDDGLLKAPEWYALLEAEDGVIVYRNLETGESQWEKPDGWDPKAQEEWDRRAAGMGGKQNKGASSIFQSAVTIQSTHTKFTFELLPGDASQDMQELFDLITAATASLGQGTEGTAGKGPVIRWDKTFETEPLPFGIKKLIPSCVVLNGQTVAGKKLEQVKAEKEAAGTVEEDLDSDEEDEDAVPPALPLVSEYELIEVMEAMKKASLAEDEGGEEMPVVQSAVVRSSEECSPDGPQDNGFEFMSSISKVMSSCEEHDWSTDETYNKGGEGGEGGRFSSFKTEVACSPAFGGAMTIFQKGNGLYATQLWHSSMMLNHFFGKYFGKELTGQDLFDGKEWEPAEPAAESDSSSSSSRRMMQRAGAAAGSKVRVLELGAGVGLAGLVMAKEGAMVTLTDNQPAALELIKQSAEACSITDNCEVAHFDWTEEKCYAAGSDEIGGRVMDYDYVVASDVVYEHRDQSGLIRAMRRFAPPAAEGARQTKIFMAYVHRTVKVDLFFTQVLAHFQMEKLDKSQLDEEFQYDKIDIFVFTPLAQ
jgi:hypothetical protein